MSELQDVFADVISKRNEYIEITDDNKISFQLQEGPVGEHGVNGCQVDDMVHAAKTIIESFNKKFPCRENSIVITKLDEALLWLGKRTADREVRGVEGTDKS